MKYSRFINADVLPRSWRRAILMSLSVIVAAGGCANRESSQVLTRITSPDSVTDAILVSFGGDATVDFSYEVYIVPRGRPAPSHDFSGFGATGVEKLRIFRETPTLLAIEFSKARIYQFRNDWRSREIKRAGYEVELVLRPTLGRSLPGSKLGG